MTRPTRFLSGNNSSSSASSTAADPPGDLVSESDFVIVIAALLCFILVGICILGVRWAILRRGHAVKSKGLKKKVLESLPSQKYDEAAKEKITEPECPICLTDYAEGEEIRVLPKCGHGFHAACVDAWLATRSSCPSCRQQILAASRCKTCGDDATPVPERREDAVNYSIFLP